MRTFLALTVLILGLNIAQAQSERLQPGDTYGNFYTGNTLFELGQKAVGTVSFGIYMGYVIAVFDSRSLSGQFCPPTKVPLQIKELTDIVDKYLVGNSSERHRDADVVVVTAFAQAWPCPKKPATPAPKPEKPGTGKQGS